MKVPSGKLTVTLLPWVHFLQDELGSDILYPFHAAPLADIPLEVVQWVEVLPQCNSESGSC